MPPIYPLPVWFLSAALYIIVIIMLIYIQKQLAQREVTELSPLLDINDSLTYNAI